jgi:ATP-dependent protease ClpP protease subunit
MAKARPGAMPMPANRQVQAFTAPQVFDRWREDVAGVRAVAAGDNVITMYDVIGEDYWTGDGVTAKGVTAQLRAIGNRPVEVHINSAGGDMFEGIAIFNALREHPQDITVKVMGMAASAASIIAMAGDTIEIGAASFLMIHNCWVAAAGNRHAMAEVAAWLEPFDAAMAGLYASKTGADVKQVTAWMDAETYMSGTTAIENGFADSLLSSDQVKTDDGARASDRKFADLRSMELSLVAAGATRAQARERVSSITGVVGARETAIQPEAGGAELLGDLAGLLAACR